MKDIKYRCNLCKRDIKDPCFMDAQGLYFAGNGFRFKHPTDCEVHVCKDCLSSMRTELKNLDNMKDPISP